jgi:hypothetical protein
MFLADLVAAACENVMMHVVGLSLLNLKRNNTNGDRKTPKTPTTAAADVEAVTKQVAVANATKATKLDSMACNDSDCRENAVREACGGATVLRDLNRVDSNGYRGI